MKVKEVIEMVYDTRPHVYSDEAICRWLSDVEGRIHNEVFENTEEFKPIIPIDDDDRILLAYEPYTNIYSLYLYAMIEFSNAETVKYSNAAAMYNSVFSDLHTDYTKKNRSKKNSKWNHIWG